MAKVYACDACDVIIKDPYTAKMREFYIGVKFDSGQAFNCNVKTNKHKVHLCDTCYNNLCNIIIRKINKERGDLQ